MHVYNIDVYMCMYEIHTNNMCLYMYIDICVYIHIP